MTKNKRVLAIIVTLVLAITMSFSALFVIKEADHNCSGNDCQICQQISICLNHFKKITYDSDTVTLTIAVIFSVLLAIGIIEYSSLNNNLVTLKVKLSN